MLKVPNKGFSRSVNEHNVQLDRLCDWIEASLLFSEEEISTSDVVDILEEEQIYSPEGTVSASSRVDDAWSELRKRERWVGGGYPFKFKYSRIIRSGDWRETPAYSFCVLLSLVFCYDSWSTDVGDGYVEQGEIFELVTKESLETQFTGWNFVQTGWSRNNAVKLAEVVEGVRSKLGELPGQMEPWADSRANEAGLDLLCYKAFSDDRIGVPVYLLQCASGKNWKDKRHTPDLKIWTKVIQFAATPRKAFAIPFALSDESFQESCNLVDGLLLDRCRLFPDELSKEEWLSTDLRRRLIEWITPRVKSLLVS